MPIYKDNTKIKNIYYNWQKVKHIYLGTNKIFSGTRTVYQYKKYRTNYNITEYAGGGAEYDEFYGYWFTDMGQSKRLALSSSLTVLESISEWDTDDYINVQYTQPQFGFASPSYYYLPTGSSTTISLSSYVGKFVCPAYWYERGYYNSRYAYKIMSSAESGSAPVLVFNSSSDSYQVRYLKRYEQTRIVGNLIGTFESYNNYYDGFYYSRPDSIGVYLELTGTREEPYT